MRLSSGLADPDLSFPSAQDEEGDQGRHGQYTEPECPAEIKEAALSLCGVQMAEEGDESAGPEGTVGEGHFGGRGMAKDDTASQRAETAAAEGAVLKAADGGAIGLGNQYAVRDPSFAVKFTVFAGDLSAYQSDISKGGIFDHAILPAGAHEIHGAVLDM